MKIPLAIGALCGLVVVGAWLGPKARRHYELYESVQSERRIPYRVEMRDLDYFTAMEERRGWHVVARSTPQPDKSWDKIFDTLRWPKTMGSVARFYTTDTSNVGLVRWMLVPDSSKLPALQTMVFRKSSGGIVYSDSGGRYIVEESSPSMVSLIQEFDGGIAEWLLVDDAMFKRIQETQRRPNQALEPTATAVTDRAAHAPRQP